MEEISALSDENYQLCAHDDSTGRKLTLLLTRTGLTMHKLVVESGQFPARDVLCGPESSSSFKVEGRKFMNQVVGRYANRLPAGKIHLVDSSREAGKTMELNLDQNEPFEAGGGNCLHSGSHGYDLKDFMPVSQDSTIVQKFQSISPAPITSKSTTSAYFHLHSPSGDQGFPEAIDILATVALELSPAPQGLDQSILSKTGPKTGIGRASFSLKAMLSHPEEVARRDGGTPINLTWHTGYILNDFRGTPSDSDGIHQHKLWIKSNEHLAVYESHLPTGEIQPNKALGVDFSTPNPFSVEAIKPISEIMPESGFDQCFLLNSSNGDGSDSSKDPKAILRSPKDDLILVFYTNQTAVQCYSANYFDGIGSRKELHRRISGEPQGGYKKQEAIYLEFQAPSSLCANLTLQQNLKSMMKNTGNHQKHEDETITNTFLYPNQVYSNWFFIDIFV